MLKDLFKKFKKENVISVIFNKEYLCDVNRLVDKCTVKGTVQHLCSFNEEQCVMSFTTYRNGEQIAKDFNSNLRKCKAYVVGNTVLVDFSRES